jgi:hypothetical protein
MTRAAKKIIILFASLIAGTQNAQGEDVYVKGRESGRGFTRLLGASCFVVAPAHVVMGDPCSEDELLKATVWGRQGRKSEAVVEGRYGDDLAILRLLAQDARAAFCETSMPIGPTNPSKLVSNPNAKIELRLRQEDGGLQVLHVEIKSDDNRRYFRVAFRDPGVFAKTMSGGVLYANEVPVGMLMEVDTNNGQGLVHRQNYVEDGVRSFFVDTVSLPWMNIERIAVPLDPAGEEIFKMAETILDLLQNDGALEIYDRYLSPRTKGWLKREFFHQSMIRHYGALAGTPAKRRLIQYAPPGVVSTGAPRQWILVIEANSGGSRFQESLSFEQTENGWRLGNIFITEAF